MELKARGLDYPYKSEEEFLAIQAIKWQWKSSYLTSIASISSEFENSTVQTIMDEISNHFFPFEKYARSHQVKDFQKMFESIRKQGPIRIKASD